jgi:hypothetical protein
MIAVLISWWHYSRTVFINAATMAILILQEFTAYAVGADWSAITNNPRVLFLLMMGLNIANIVLRFLTTKPVGEK